MACILKCVAQFAAGAGYSNTDHVYYVTAKKTGSCGEHTIAYTIICHMEAFTFRPNVAAINLCPRFWTLGEPLGSKQVSALVHEMIHGLVSCAAAEVNNNRRSAPVWRMSITYAAVVFQQRVRAHASREYRQQVALDLVVRTHRASRWVCAEWLPCNSCQRYAGLQ